MWRQPLLQPAALLVRRGARTATRAQAAQPSAWVQVWQRAWKQPPAWPLSGGNSIRTMASRTMTPRKTTPATASPSPFLGSARSTPRRAFHSSRPRRAQEGPKGGAGEAKSGGPGSEAGPGAGSSSAAAEPLTLSARLKKLSREYGWTALGVYFGLSLLDFPFCFLLVRTLGTDRIAAAEEFVVSHVKAVIPASVQDYWRKYREELRATKQDGAVGKAAEADETAGWGVEEAEERNRHEASLATQLALAYAIHKSFIFVRVPLTAAVTPKVVRVLRSWGWKIGKQKPVA